MVQLAIDTYGSLDILVNNAGILRDRMIFNMSEEEWDSVIRVHLKGHFCPSRHAAAYWRDMSKEAGGPVYARIINTDVGVGAERRAGPAELLGGEGRHHPAHAHLREQPPALRRERERHRAEGAHADDGAARRVRHRRTATSRSSRPRTCRRSSRSSRPRRQRGSPVRSSSCGVARSRRSSGPRVDRAFDTPERWTPDNVSTALVPFYEDREPLAGMVIGYGPT